MLIQQGSIIGGKLRLERPLAQGGMGSIWVARHLALDTDVAVKFMGAEIAASESARTRFEREAKASVLIKSPHVVQVFDYGIEENTPYIVMELLSGEDLATKLEREGRMSLQATYRLLDPVCKALKRAHDLGLVHRDLKPGNIFLAHHDDEEVVKILDFGIAKTTKFDSGPAVTKSHSFLGSPSYMSAEQINRSKDVDLRSDLWSLGVILYEMLTGHVPFEREDFGALLIAICSESFPPPSSLVPELDPAVDRFFERALSRDLSARFQNARELADAFAVLAGIRAPALSQPATQELAARATGKFPQAAAAPDTAKGASSPDLAAGEVNPNAPTVAENAPAAAATGSRVAAAQTVDKVSLSVTGSGDTRQPPRKSRVMIFGIGAGAATAAVIAMLAFRAGTPADVRHVSVEHSQQVESTATAPAPGLSVAPTVVPATQPAAISGRLEISPADATVEVDGRAALVKDGAIELQGAPGSEHQVRLRKDQQDKTVTITLTPSGPAPAKIDLTPIAPGQTAPAVTTAAGPSKAPPAGRRPPHTPGSTKNKEPTLSREFK